MLKFFPYIQAMRLKTILISFSLWIVGLSLSVTKAPIEYLLNGMILFCMAGLQISVNYFNDIVDFRRNRDTSDRLGPQRVIHSQLLTEKSLIEALSVVIFLTLISGAYLVFKGGWPIALIGISGLFLTYFYSAPPLAIADRGLSEIFVFLYFGVLAVCGIFYLNTMSWGIQSLVAGSQMGFLSISLLLVNHLRDHVEDQKTGKNTWVVRKGRNFGLIELACSIFFPYIIGYYWLVVENQWETFLYPLSVLPFHVYIFYKISREAPSQAYNFYLALTSFGQLLFATSLLFSWALT